MKGYCMANKTDGIKGKQIATITHKPRTGRRWTYTKRLNQHGATHAITGYDTVTGAVGVLEWASSREEAEGKMLKMAKDTKIKNLAITDIFKDILHTKEGVIY